MTAVDSPSRASAPAALTPADAVWGLRLATGLGGILVAVMMSGLNNRVGGLALADMAGAKGMGHDDAKLLGTAFFAAEFAAMPIAAWFATTLSLRRFILGVVIVFLICAVLLPLAPTFGWMLSLRMLQGLAGGALIPLLMSAALRFLPPAIKLQGLGFYSLTATFAPNLGLWLAAVWVDGLADWRFIYWQVIPAGLFVLWAVWWGIPQDPIRFDRLRQIDWMGLLTGPAGLMLCAFAAEEGSRYDWFHSPLITGSFVGGLALVGIFFISEWYHPSPFFRLQLLVEKRNYGLGVPLFVGLLIAITLSSVLPLILLQDVDRFRPEQLAPLGLIIGLPQIVLAPVVSLTLYQKHADARHIMALGLMMMAVSCWLASYVSSDWMVAEFWVPQVLQMMGQPLAVVGFLYLVVGITGPTEGPYLTGLINTFKSVASVGGAVLAERLLQVGMADHLRALADRVGRLGGTIATDPTLPERIGAQALTATVADLYRLTGLLSLLLIVPTLLLTYVAPPRAAKD